MNIKNWQNPRDNGKQRKGTGGSARAKQVRKAMRQMANRLKKGSGPFFIRPIILVERGC